MSDPRTLQINLNPNGVSAPAQKVVIIAARVVGTALRALAKDDLSPPEMQGGHWGYSFQGLDLSSDEWRKTLENWVLSKGFQDLARGIRETLEEAIFYLSMIGMQPGKTTWGKVQADIASIRARAAGYTFPKLLQEVNLGLAEPMAFEPEFRSLQKVRNCLEHRGGIVEATDVDPETGLLTLTFPRLKMFYLRGKEEVEVVPGEVIDTLDPSNPFGGDDEVTVMMRRVNRSRAYALGESVTITASDFFEIAMACNMFAGDVAAKLPTLPIQQGGPRASTSQ